METTASGEIETLIESLGLHSSLRSLVGFRLFVCLFVCFFFLYTMPADSSKRSYVSLLRNGSVNNGKCTKFIN